MLGCKSKVAVILMAVVLLLPALAGCAKEEPKMILIGTAVSLTGKESVSGTCARNAYELAIKEVNDRGGIEVSGRKLPARLIVYDDESDPEKSASLIERLITGDKVDVLLGGNATPTVELQSEVAEKYHIPFVNGGGAASQIYAKGYEWIFGTYSSSKRGGITLMDFIREQQEEGNLPQPLKIAVVWENTSYGKDVRNGIKQRAGEFPNDFEIVLDESFTEMTTDFTSLLNKVKRAPADVFISITHLADFMLMHRQYTELGLSHLLVSYGAQGMQEVAHEELGSAVDYLVSFAWWSKEMPYPQVKEFLNKYETAYGKPPEFYAAPAYEAARALLQAIEEAGSLEKAKIRDALIHLKLTCSILVGETLSFEENGQADYPLLIIQNQPDGTSPIIYPADAAITKATVPRPKVQFGCALSLSGDLKETGRLYKQGYELWEEHINSQGGILIGNERYLVDILYYDDESDPRKTAPLVEKLITEDKVDFLLGPYGSSATFEAAAIAEKYRIPMVQGGGSAEKIFTSGFKYTFGLLSPAGDYFKNILIWATSINLVPRKVAIVSKDDLFSLSAAEGAKRHAERLGFEVVSFITFESEAELSSVLSELKENEPNIVLFCSHFGEALSFVRTAKTGGLSPEMFGITVAPSDPAFVEELGKDAEYIFGTTDWTSALPYYGPVFGSSQDYAQLFREKFGEEPDYHAAAATACGVTYQLALEKAASLDSEDVRDALASLDAMTFYGRIKFNEQGRDIYKPMVAVQIQQGKTVTIWPMHLATGSAKYPTPPWEEREPELKVAVLHIGPIGDYGWTYEGHLGAQEMAEELPYVELSEREEACGTDTPQIMKGYADAGYKVIFCHSWDFGEYIQEVAPAYPNVIFMWGSGVEKKAPNVGIYFARMYEGEFLAGIVAGAMTKTNKIGYAAAMPTSEVVRGIDAFAKGVASVNSEAKVYVEWIGEWYNPPKEKEVTLSLIDKGCDIITHHADSYAPAQAAEEKGIYYISFNSDMRRFAPHVFLTGVVWNWTPIMTDIVKVVHDGTWDQYPGQDWWYGLAEGGIKLAPFSDLVPENVREMVGEKKQAIIEGKFEVFPGMSDKELREIYYFEPNVVGELP